MEIKSDLGTYKVLDRVADDEKYRLYLCFQDETKRQCLLQISTATEHNGDLARGAYILRELERRAIELEEEYAEVKTDPKNLLNYGLGFPELLDSFICQQQGGRQVNILAFRNVEDVGNLVPLVNITAKDKLRVDLRTSAWIMGKLLKLLNFAHSEGISAYLVTGKNILIEPAQHYVLIFDWSFAKTLPGVVPPELRRKDISQAAQAVIAALGGDPQKGTLPDSGKEGARQYTDFILKLARGSESSTQRAHVKFYELIDSIWERKFYPFTTKPLAR